MLTRNPWTLKQKTILIVTINWAMKRHGHVDFGIVSKQCGHSKDSCETKARDMDIKFSKRVKRKSCNLRGENIQKESALARDFMTKKCVNFAGM